MNLERIRKLNPQIKSNIRYKLSSKIMQENFLYWLNLSSTEKLLIKLLDNCKQKDIILSAPNPFFKNNINNSLSNSQIEAEYIIPPASPKIRKSLQTEKESSEKKKRIESLTNSLISSMKLSTIPKFYFPTVGLDIIKKENDTLDSIFNKSNKLTIKSFLKITKEFYNFPELFNKILFTKIDIKNKGYITRDQFMKFHIQNFRGCSITERFFNLIKSPERKYIIKEDFNPLLKEIINNNPSLEIIKDNIPFQKKYSNAVITRIFYQNDVNDDGKITLHDFKRSDLIQVIIQACEDDDINNIRQYFSYEHFYVAYYIFWKLTNIQEPDKDLFLNKENFSKYDYHGLGRKVVDRIFAQIPRKFVSSRKDMMCFEDFLWYILSEEDKTNPTSIKYWFKVLDLDDNGIITPSEMEYFYQEQIQRLENYQNEVIEFNDILCQLYDMIPPEKEYQWTLQNFLKHPQYTSIAFNILFNFTKFIAFEKKDPVASDEIQRRRDYTDWDKFAYNEYDEINEENEEGELYEEGSFIED